MKPTRAVVAAAVFAMVGLLGVSPAGATDETIGSCMVETIEELGGAEAVETILEAGHGDGADEAAKEELHHVEEELESCVEAPSMIIPELNEIIWGGLAFLVLLAAMIRWGFPAVRGAMEGRTAKIQGDLDEAANTRSEAEKVKAQHDAELANSKAEVAKIYDEARQDAAAVKADLQARAEADIAEMRQRAEADVAAARERALGDLQGEVNEIVVGAAERVVERNLDPAAQQQLIENYIANVGSR